MTLITLRRYLQPVDAELDRARLEAEGIPVFLQDASLMTLTTADSPGVRLQVDEEHAARARELLDAPPGDLLEDGENRD